jgi:hypothetical protein
MSQEQIRIEVRSRDCIGAIATQATSFETKQWRRNRECEQWDQRIVPATLPLASPSPFVLFH